MNFVDGLYLFTILTWVYRLLLTSALHSKRQRPNNSCKYAFKLQCKQPGKHGENFITAGCGRLLWGILFSLVFTLVFPSWQSPAFPSARARVWEVRAGDVHAQRARGGRRRRLLFRLLQRGHRRVRQTGHFSIPSLTVLFISFFLLLSHLTINYKVLKNQVQST